MSWKVWGNKFFTANALTTDIYQPVTFHTNVSILACRAWFIWQNDPTFTNIFMKIYSDNGGVPGYLLNTSDSFDKADFISNTHGVKEIFFTFATKPTFSAEDVFHFVVGINGYTGDDTSHLAWKLTFPDPPYREGLTLDFEHLLKYPYDLTFVGSQL